MAEQSKAMLVEYTFTRSDGRPLNAARQREMDDSMFELIGGWAQKRGLMVEGQALFERLTDEKQDGLVLESGHVDVSPEQVEKAALWDALMGSGRLRILGWADPDSTGYAHFGLEAWTRYPGYDFSESNARAQEVITDYCRTILAHGPETGA